MMPSYIVLKRLGYKSSAPLNQTKGKVDVLVKIEHMYILGIYTLCIFSKYINDM